MVIFLSGLIVLCKSDISIQSNDEETQEFVDDIDLASLEIEDSKTFLNEELTEESGPRGTLSNFSLQSQRKLIGES